MDQDEILWLIDSEYFTAGLVARKSIVVRAAPILGYMIGWTLPRVFAYCSKKQWRISQSTERIEPMEQYNDKQN